MSYISRAAISVWLWIYWCAAMLLHVTAFLLAIPVLAVWLLPDVLPGRGPSRSTYPQPPRRRREIPVREGSDIFVITQDGTKEEVGSLEASNLAKAWAEVVAGAYVFEKTRIRDTDIQ